MPKVTKKCNGCKTVRNIALFGKKKDGSFYSRCPECREKEKKAYKHVKKSFLDEFPDLKEEWDWEKNEELGLLPEKLSMGSHKKAWWKCKSGKECHFWQTYINSRTGKTRPGCPFCSNKKTCSCGCNSLYESNPELREEWVEEKNGSMKLFVSNSGKRVWWICKNNRKCHQWKTQIRHRSGESKSACPFCSNRKICPCGCNSLYESNPELIEEWDKTRNGSMKLFSPKSGKKVWWICLKRKCHSWRTTVISRTGKKKSGCPKCSSSKLETSLEKILNSLQLTTPSLFYEPQKRFKNVSFKKSLPYDFYLSLFKTTKIRIDLQGRQHFFYDSKYFHKRSKNNFPDQIQKDNIKSFQTSLSSDNFLSISYLCLDNLEKVLTDFIASLVPNKTIFRYHITPDLFLEYSQDYMILPEIPENNDEILTIYQFYYYNIQSLLLERQFKPKLSVCELCEKTFLSGFLPFHYNTDEHKACLEEKRNELEEKYDNFFSLTEDGEPILLEE